MQERLHAPGSVPLLLVAHDAGELRQLAAHGLDHIVQGQHADHPAVVIGHREPAYAMADMACIASLTSVV